MKPGWAQCAREHFTNDLSSGGATTMVSTASTAPPPTATSSAADGDYVNQWIAARAGAGSEPSGSCADFPLPWTDTDGKTGMTCEVPPNDL